MPPTPPASNKEKSSPRATFRQANRVVALFKNIKSGQLQVESQPWKKFQLQPGEYDEIERLVLADTDTSLWGFIEDKIRYDFDCDRNQLIIQMPTRLHERFLTLVKQDIDAQLKLLATSTILEESVTHFAQRIYNCGSPDIPFPIGIDIISMIPHKSRRNTHLMAHTTTTTQNGLALSSKCHVRRSGRI